MFYVYIHRKADTGEVFYVGKGHGRRAYVKTNRSNHWKSVVKKHGYIVEFIETGLQEWAAFEMEVSYVNYYGRKDTGHGPLVNFTDGGEGSSGHVWSDELRAWRSNETKKQMQDPSMLTTLSEAKKGKKLSEEHADKSRKVLLAQKDKVKKINAGLMADRWTTQSYREKMRKLQTGKVMSDSVKLKIGMVNSKKVKRSDGVVYSSLQEAAKEIGKSHSKISMVVTGKRKTAYGYGWEFA